MDKPTQHPLGEPELIATPATATAAGHTVLLEHSQGVALSFTPEAAAETARSLTAAADCATNSEALPGVAAPENDRRDDRPDDG